MLTETKGHTDRKSVGKMICACWCYRLFAHAFCIVLAHDSLKAKANQVNKHKICAECNFHDAIPYLKCVVEDAADYKLLYVSETVQHHSIVVI